MRDSALTFVIVPTPSDARGAFSLDAAARAFDEIGRALAKKDAYHLVVLTSTVLPGATRQGCFRSWSGIGQDAPARTSASATAPSSSRSAASSATSSTPTSR